MSTALVPVQSTAIEKAEFTREQIDLIKQTVAKGCSDLELQLLLYTAQKRGLDPLLKQIYGITREVSVKTDSGWTKQKQMTLQTGIDGFRLIASRTGQLAGIEDAVIEESPDKKHPLKASVTVYRVVHGTRCPFTATARWDEYKQVKYDGNLMGLWAKMPFTMLSKCAESLALRKAFPEDLSGLYTTDEMAQADSEAPKLIPTRKTLQSAAKAHEEAFQHIIDKAEGKVSGDTTQPDGGGTVPAVDIAGAPEESPEAQSYDEAERYTTKLVSVKPLPSGAKLELEGRDGKAWVAWIKGPKWIEYLIDQQAKAGCMVDLTVCPRGAEYEVTVVWSVTQPEKPLKEQIKDSIEQVKARARKKVDPTTNIESEKAPF